MPLDELLNALLDRGIGLESDIAHQVVHVGTGDGNFTWLHRQHPFLGFATQFFLQHFDEFQQIHWGVIADVIEPVRSMAGNWIRR